jgi:glutathione S-transferase
MMTLLGFPFSNYYCMVKHALLFKDLSFNENIIYTSDPALKKISPAGKVPALTTESGVLLSESSVLLDYLEDWYAMMADSDISRQLDQESQANFSDFIAAISA